MNNYNEDISRFLYESLINGSVQYTDKSFVDKVLPILVRNNNIAKIYSEQQIYALLQKFNRNINTFLPNQYVSTTTSIVPEFQSTQSGTNLDEILHNMNSCYTTNTYYPQSVQKYYTRFYQYQL